jgi:hypothetical protein
MADRELQTILNSGEITSIYLGSPIADNKVVTAGDVELSILGVGSVVPLAQQTLAAGVPEVYTWITTDTISQGGDITYSATTQRISILTSGVYKIAGTQVFTAGNVNYLQFCLRINGVQAPICNSNEGRGSSQAVSVSSFGVLTLSAGDYLEVWVESTGTDITCQSSSVFVEKIS